MALTYIYGIGDVSKICEEAEIDPASSSDDLTENDVVNLRRITTRISR